MRRLKWGLGIAAAIVIIAGGAGAAVHAQRFTNYTGNDDVVNSSLYSAGESITIKGTVNGDIFCAGRTVLIDATVHGDVLCAGQDVTIAGTVDGDVRVAGETVSISAKVSRAVTVAASDFSLDAPAGIGRDLTAFGNTLNLKGEVGRDVLLNGARATVSGNVSGDVRFEGDQLEVRGANVEGRVTNISRHELKRSGDLVITGGVDQRSPPKKQGLNFNFGWYAMTVMALTLVSLAVVLIAPRTLRSLSQVIGTAWVSPMLVGLAASVVLPFLAILLFVTVVGIPLGGLLFLVWISLLMLSGPVVAYYLGRRILAKQPNVLVTTLAGSLLLVTAYFIPILGFIVLLTAYWTGSGAILLAVKRRLGKPGYSIT